MPTCQSSRAMQLPPASLGRTHRKRFLSGGGKATDRHIHPNPARNLVTQRSNTVQQHRILSTPANSGNVKAYSVPNYRSISVARYRSSFANARKPLIPNALTPPIGSRWSPDRNSATKHLQVACANTASASMSLFIAVAIYRHYLLGLLQFAFSVPGFLPGLPGSAWWQPAFAPGCR